MSRVMSSNSNTVSLTIVTVHRMSSSAMRVLRASSSLLISRPAVASQISVRCLSVARALYASADSNNKVPSPADGKVYSPQVKALVESIANLTLLETADLVQLLKTKLNISEVAVPVSVAASSANAAPAAAAEAAPEVKEPKVEKTQFNIKVEKYDPSAKAKIIREVKNLIAGMGLVEAKNFVESVPKVLKEKVPKEDAEKIKKTLEDLGATVILE